MGMPLEAARKLVEKHGGNVSEASRAANMPRSTLASILSKGRKKTRTSTERKTAVGISKAEFMAEYDPTTKTKLALRNVVREHLEDDRYIKDHELRKLAGVGDPRLWRDIADDPDEGFTKYQFEFGGTRWWTTPKSRDEMVSSNPKTKAV